MWYNHAFVIVLSEMPYMRLSSFLFTILLYAANACAVSSSISIENGTTINWNLSAQLNDESTIITPNPLPETLPALDSIMIDIISQEDANQGQIILSQAHNKQVVLTINNNDDIQISYCAPKLHCSKEIAAEFTNIHIE